MVVPRLQADKALAQLRRDRLKPFLMGEIVRGNQDVRFA